MLTNPCPIVVNRQVRPSRYHDSGQKDPGQHSCLFQGVRNLGLVVVNVGEETFLGSNPRSCAHRRLTNTRGFGPRKP